MLDQRRRRWANVVQMLYKCFVPAGYNISRQLDLDHGYVTSRNLRLDQSHVYDAGQAKEECHPNQCKCHRCFSLPIPGAANPLRTDPANTAPGWINVGPVS